jgi:hypothetical protein
MLRRQSRYRAQARLGLFAPGAIDQLSSYVKNVPSVAKFLWDESTTVNTTDRVRRLHREEFDFHKPTGSRLRPISSRRSRR